MEGPTDPYLAIAELYDAEWATADADTRWFASNVRGRSALVLGCGTGRVARALIAPERAVTGLDRSAPMLSVARRRLPEIRWIEGDMRSFELGRFETILAPNAAFSFLATRADQAACLASCARALTDGGELWIDLPMPDARWLAESHTPELPAWEDGAGAHRTREVRRFPVAQRLELTDRYYRGATLIATSVLELRLTWPGEAEWMLESAGLYADALFGDYQGRPLREECPRLLIRARKL